MNWWRLLLLALAVALTLALAGGATFLRASAQVTNDIEMARRQRVECTRQYQEQGLTFEDADERCRGSNAVHRPAHWEALLRAAVPFGLIVAAGFWLVVGILFFGIRLLSGGRDEPDTEG